tara:strand:+ start:199 stop:879 length:681 start_codon:yes stop_codon:yes gene_type:complete
MKLICFSLWGDIPMYTVGAVKNVELANELFPDWTCRFYIANSVPRNICTQLEELGAELITRDNPGTTNSMFWRFEPAADETVDAMIVRDTDSRLGIREKLAVDEWLASNKKLHIMRDHPYHQAPMLGGMWGCRPVLLPDLSDKIKYHIHQNPDEKGSDQHFLWSHVYPKFREDSFVHDPFFDNKTFPIERNEDPLVEFIGQVFDENDRYAGDWENDLGVLGDFCAE